MKIVVKITGLTLVLMLMLGNYGAGAEEQKQTVYLGGQPFGVKFYNDGVIIVNLEEYFDGHQYVCPAKSGGLKVNDIIKTVNGTEIRCNEDLQKAATESEGQRLDMLISRDGKELRKNILPRKNTVGVYLLGAWVRDSCAGIGTVTYYDKEHHYFAALGHGICDRDTGALLPLGSAEIVSANISSATKSSVGSPGSLNGYFTDKSLGVMTKNTESGVFGTIFDNNREESPGYEIADFDEIRTGEAEMITTVSGSNPQVYEIEINKICNDDETSNENFVIKVTDSRLLDSCGGIVQGMSGSPIVQDGKIIGAVTHVFLNRPEEGYGVAAQFMASNYHA